MQREIRLAGHRVLALEEVDSTSAHARRLLEAGALAAGDAVVAGRQSAGRGRRGRSWVTVPGRSLAASLVLAPPPLARPTRLTVLAAVAACRALESCGARGLAIKWPNDLMRADRKCGGLLVETAAGAAAGAGGRDAGPPLCVLGIGINLELRPGDLPAELAERAGDAGLPGDEGTRERLLAALLTELDAALAQVGGPGDRERGAEYRRRSWLVGRQAELSAAGERLVGRIADVSEDGDLVLEGGRLLAGESVELIAVLPPGERAASR
jgi:BirA family biotin operon repressor/biotin-[acetyl-CoA-carboxylase] ligase